MMKQSLRPEDISGIVPVLAEEGNPLLFRWLDEGRVDIKGCYGVLKGSLLSKAIINQKNNENGFLLKLLDYVKDPATFAISNHRNFTPLHIAILQKNWFALDAMLERGAKYDKESLIDSFKAIYNPKKIEQITLDLEEFEKQRAEKQQIKIKPPSSPKVTSPFWRKALTKVKNVISFSENNYQKLPSVSEMKKRQ